MSGPPSRASRRVDMGTSPDTIRKMRNGCRSRRPEPGRACSIGATGRLFQKSPRFGRGHARQGGGEPRALIHHHCGSNWPCSSPFHATRGPGNTRPDLISFGTGVGRGGWGRAAIRGSISRPHPRGSRTSTTGVSTTRCWCGSTMGTPAAARTRERRAADRNSSRRRRREWRLWW